MDILNTVRCCIGALLLLFGAFIFVVEIIGVFKFRYVLNRMHAAAMGDTLGLGSCLLGLVCITGLSFTTLKLIFVLVFFWFSSPTASHLIAKMEIESKENDTPEFEQLDLDKKEDR